MTEELKLENLEHQSDIMIKSLISVLIIFNRKFNKIKI